MTSLFDKVPVQGREILLSVKRKFSKLYFSHDWR